MSQWHFLRGALLGEEGSFYIFACYSKILSQIWTKFGVRTKETPVDVPNAFFCGGIIGGLYICILLQGPLTDLDQMCCGEKRYPTGYLNHIVERDIERGFTYLRFTPRSLDRFGLNLVWGQRNTQRMTQWHFFEGALLGEEFFLFIYLHFTSKLI